jgi:hypothetical protein
LSVTLRRYYSSGIKKEISRRTTKLYTYPTGSNFYRNRYQPTAYEIRKCVFGEEGEG